MAACNSLRIDPGNGSPIVEYRIRYGSVETRTLRVEEVGDDKPWRKLSPEQLTSHVMSSPVLAYWLPRRMGVHSVVRACAGDSTRIRDEVSL